MKSTDQHTTHRRGLSLIVLGLTLSIFFLMGGSCDPGIGKPEPDPYVSGHVLDSITGQPIDSARVWYGPDSLVADDPRVDYSDSTGTYLVLMSALGWNYVHCSKAGYITDSIRVYYGGSVVNDSVDFLLVPE